MRGRREGGGGEKRKREETERNRGREGESAPTGRSDTNLLPNYWRCKKVPKGS